MMLPEHEQSLMQKLGEAACYLLVCQKIAELYTGRVFNPLQVFRSALLNGWIQSDMLVLSAEAIVGELTGKKWWKKKVLLQSVNSLENELENEIVPQGTLYIAARYTKNIVNGTKQHFVLWDPSYEIWYNPLELPFGKDWSPESLRCFGPCL